jgi:hypothetical protein
MQKRKNILEKAKPTEKSAWICDLKVISLRFCVSVFIHFI